MAPSKAMRSISVKQAIEEYRTYNRAQNYSPSYVDCTDRNLHQFACWLAAEGRAQEISRLTLDDARAFIVYQRERENLIRPGTHISPEYVQQYARGLKSWASFLEAEGFTASNLFSRLGRPRVPVREPEVLTQEEIARVVAIYNPKCATDLRNMVLILTLVDTGLRLSELCNATVDDVDLDRGTLKVMGKGMRERTVHLGATVQKLLARYLRYLRPEPATAHVRNLLLTPDGTPFASDAARCVLKRAAVISSVRRLHAHLLRHTFATHYLLNGGDLLTLQRLLGHSTLEMVRRYSHVAASFVAVQHRQYSPVDRISVRLSGRKPSATAATREVKRPAERRLPARLAGPQLHIVGGGKSA
jgi:site-specific recombinase XerD